MKKKMRKGMLLLIKAISQLPPLGDLIFYLTKGQTIFSGLKWFRISLCCHFTVSLVGSGGILRGLNDGT